MKLRNVIILLISIGSAISLDAVCAIPSLSLEPADTVTRTKRIYHTLRIDNPPVIDGKLNDNCWALGEWQGDYTQFTPVYNGKATNRTELKILYDDKNIFVAIRAFDDINKISRKLGRRDNFLGDIAGVHFDSYFDHRSAFEFDLSAAGQKLDLWVSNDGWDLNWNAVWYGKVAYEDSAWTAEYRIPLSQLRYGPDSVQVWGLDSWRYIERLQEENQWNLVANDGTGLVYTFGELHGLEGLKKARRIELLPYASGKLTTSEKLGDNPLATGRRYDWLGGLDAKIGITNNFTLDATINPDFGQVEADPSVMNLSAFETYYEEKRPFFVEGKNIFDYTFDQDQLFYTRRIGHKPSYEPGGNDPYYVPEFTTIGSAFKLSGKTSSGLSLGIIESLALKEQATINDGIIEHSETAEPLTNYFIGRFQKDFDKGNTILGGIVTNTHRFINDKNLNFLANDALTCGIDFTRYWKDRTYFFEVKGVGSNIEGDAQAIRRIQTSSARYFQRPDIGDNRYDTTLTSINGFGASIKAGKWSKGHWRYNEEFVFRSPGLELNDLGYMKVSDIIKNNSTIQYVEKENKGIFKLYDFRLEQNNAWDSRGNGLYSEISLGAETEFMNGWAAEVEEEYKFRTTDDRLLRGGPAMRVPDMLETSAMVHTNNSRNLFFMVDARYGKSMESGSYFLEMESQVSYRPWSNLLLSVQPSYQKVLDELQYIRISSSSLSDKSYLLATIDNRNLGLTFRADLAITPELTIQYYGSPFVSIAKFYDYKEVVDPLNGKYENRIKMVNPSEVVSGVYYFDNNHDLVTDCTVADPGFDYSQFRSNMVLRWEYRAGSTLYLVWAQERTDNSWPGKFSFSRAYKNLHNAYPSNIFMLKFNYWFSL